MPLDVDGAAVLRAVANAPDVFSDITEDLNAFAHKMVVKQLKAKGTDIARVRGVCAAIGADNFSLIVDSLADSGRSLLVKIDKYNPDVKSSDSPWLRKHLNELAQGSMEPVDRPPRNTKSTKKQISGSAQKRKPSTKRAISIKAFETKWDGKSRDD